MCLIVLFRDEKKADLFMKGQILKKNMTVYKGLNIGKNDKYLSPYRDMTYTPGFHYYQTGKNPIDIKKAKDWGGALVVKINRALHSCVEENGALDNGELSFKMIIPKGARVWIDKVSGEVASTELIFPHQ